VGQVPFILDDQTLTRGQLRELRADAPAPPAAGAYTSLLAALAEGFAGQTWRRDAACVGVDVNVMVPDRGESAAKALAICARCPVRLPCLEEALQLGCYYARGVWGSSTGRDRRSARRRGWSAQQLLDELDRGRGGGAADSTIEGRTTM
jgi:WhiB family redox-sensing transcriptional regulator